MSIENKIKVMEASAKGMTIQYRDWIGHGLWEVVDNPSWDWSKYDYRVKPIYHPKDGEWVVCRTADDTHAIHIRQWCGEAGAPYKSSGVGAYKPGYYKEVEPYIGQSLLGDLKLS